jgi:hypothetical protein
MGLKRKKTALALLCAAMSAAAMLAAMSNAAAVNNPVAGQTVHFQNGYWSGAPQVGPDGKVRQCVMVASRPRAGASGPVDTALSIDIGRGAGLGFAIMDDGLPAEDILDDEAEIVLDGHAYPADGFTVTGHDLAFHPGDAAGVLSALAKTKVLQLRSAGARVDTGPITIDLPADALAWLQQCGRQFAIPIDQPSDPNAPPLPTPRPPSPVIGTNEPTQAGPPGIDDKQKIARWDASELRDNDGKVIVCFIRQHYGIPPQQGQAGRSIGTFLALSRSKGLNLMLKDSVLNLPGNEGVPATLTIDDKPFISFESHVLGSDEIGIFPQHGAALAAALGDGVTLNFKSKVEGMEFAVPAGVVPWLRACGNRWNIPFEPQSSSN